jgi:release factor glutamine methyltransferase
MTIQLAYQQLLLQLYKVYDTREAANIADMVIENVTGQRKIDRILYKELPVNFEQQERLEKLGTELLQHRPVQYVLGEAWFMDMRLKVSESVLIPRPETEELVAWILTDFKMAENNQISLIDIGTGSGCIPVAIKKKKAAITVSAIDISREALMTARENAVNEGASIDFIDLNFLQELEWDKLGCYDIIVSNPPYIKQSEELSMRDNVLKFEPKLALFVPDEDALLFYKAIAKFSVRHLKPKGSIYVEINEILGKDVVELFEKQGFVDVKLRKDMRGKDRMIKATKR